MSRADLLAVQGAHAFDDAPKRDELGWYHVPFQDIVGPSRIEDNLLAACRRRERLAIVGDSGAGKSSLINGSLGPLAADIAPVIVPVSAEPRDTIVEPRSMFAVIGAAIVRQAREAGAVSDQRADEALAETTTDRRVGRAPERARRFGFGVLGNQVSTDLTRQFEERQTIERSADETLATVGQMMDMLRDPGGLVPVLVFDDSDRWLGDADNTTRREFFGRMLPSLRELPCALVVAIHRHDLSDDNLRSDITRTLEVRIDVPRLPSVEALRAVLDSRTQAHCQIEIRRVIDQTGLHRIFAAYTAGLRHELRGVLKTVHVALTEACDARAERITDRHIDAAIALWDSP
jgi:hypothetical protein